MQKKIMSTLLLGLLSTATLNTYAADKVWITLGDAAYSELLKLAPKTIAKERKVLPLELFKRASTKCLYSFGNRFL